MLRSLQLVEDRDSIVLKGYKAFSFVVHQQLVAGRAVFSRAIPRRDLRSRTQIGPVEPLGFFAKNRERLSSFARFFTIDLRKVRRVREGFARRDLEAARATDIKHT